MTLHYNVVMYYTVVTSYFNILPWYNGFVDVVMLSYYVIILC